MFKSFFVKKFKKLLPSFLIVGIFSFLIFTNIYRTNGAEVLVDGDFSSATSSSSLITNDTGYDWYESRADTPPSGANQLSLDETDIAGNSTKKAKFTGSTSYNTYMSQEIPSPITNGTITVEWDIYIDSIINQTYDRSGFMFLGNDSLGTQGPASTDVERYVILAFDKSGGGETGAASLTYRDRDDAIGAFTVATSTLALDTWYTVKLIADTTADTFDLYVNDMQVANDATTRKASINITHISFATWNDGAGTFYVDNITFDDGLVPTFTQNNYRWYVNADSITPTDAWPSGGTDINENTNITSDMSPADEDVMRLRMTIQDGATALLANTQAFKLQFGTGETCSGVTNWQDIGEASSTTAPWRGYDNGSVSDGATISSLVLTGSDVGGTYEEENNSANNPNAVAVGEDAEYDWVIQAHDTLTDANYCFRMVESDGTLLGTYTRYPQITFASVSNPTFIQNNFRFYVNADSITPTDPWPSGGTDIALNTDIASTTAPTDEDIIRLRISVQDGTAELGATTQAFKL